MASSKWDDTLPAKGADAWGRATKGEREAALRDASQIIDKLPWKGKRASERQGLEWPRVGIFRDDGAPIVGVPDEVKEAVALLAGFILAEIPMSGVSMAHVFLRVGHLLNDDTRFRQADIADH